MKTWSKISFRKLWSVLTVLSICTLGTVVALKESKDPLDPKMSALESQMKKLWEDPSQPGVLKKVDLKSQAYKDFLVRLQEMKSAIEAASPKRVADYEAKHQKAYQKRALQLFGKDGPQTPEDSKKISGDDKLINYDSKIESEIFGHFGDILNRYLMIQANLLGNYLKNAYDTSWDEASIKAFPGYGVGHQNRGYDIDRFDDYNVKIDFEIGNYFVLNNDAFQLRYNLWHTFRHKQILGRYDQVEMGLNPEQKYDLERTALTSNPSYFSYGALVQLLVAHERIINHWAISRMSSKGDQIDESVLDHCGEFLSLNKRYLQWLYQTDRREEFLAIQKHLVPVIKKKPFLNLQQRLELNNGFFETFINYQSLKDSFTFQQVSDYQNSVQKKLDLENADLEKNINGLIDHVNYFGDSFDDYSVASRIATEVYYYRWHAVVSSLTAHVISQGWSDFGSTESEVYEKAARYTNDYMEKHDHDLNYWQVGLLGALQDKLKSPEAETIRRAKRNQNFEKKLEEIVPVVNYAASANYIKKKIISTAKDHRSEWVKQGLVLTDRDSKNYLGLISSMPMLPLNLEVQSAQQVQDLFVRKLTFWFKDRAISPDRQKLAAEISTNKRVTDWIAAFFMRLHIEHTRLRLEANAPENSEASKEIFNKILIPIAKKNYSDFLAAESNQDKVATKTSDSLDIPRRAVPPPPQPDSLAIANLTKPNLNFIDPSTLFTPVKGLVTPEDRLSKIKLDFTLPYDVQKRDQELYIQAMAILNLAEMVTGTRREPHWPVSNILYPLSIHMHTFVDIETALRRQWSESKPLRKVVQSLEDQKILAEILNDQAMTEDPLLKIQFDVNNAKKYGNFYLDAFTMNLIGVSREDSPPLLDKMIEATRLDVDSATHEIGVPKSIQRGFLRQAVKQAEIYDEPLVGESCRARPFAPGNEEYQRIFRSSTNIRTILQQTDQRFAPFETALKKDTRILSEKILDGLEPVVQVAQWIGYALMALFLIYISAGLYSVFVLGGSYAAGTGIVAASMGGLGFMNLLNWGVLIPFIAQLGFMFHVNCIEMPSELRYRMQVVHTQVAPSDFYQTTYKDIRDFSHEIHQGKVTNITYMVTLYLFPKVFNKVAQVVMTGKLPTGFWVTGSKAMQRWAQVSGEVVDAQAGRTSNGVLLKSKVEELPPNTTKLVEDIRAKTFSEHVNRNGNVEGAYNYFKEKYQSLKRFGRLSALGQKVRPANVKSLFSARMIKLLKTPEKVDEMLAADISEINEKMNKLGSGVSDAYLLSEGGAEPYRFTDKMKIWLRNLNSTFLFGKAYWKMATSPRVLEELPKPELQDLILDPNTDTYVLEVAPRVIQAMDSFEASVSKGVRWWESVTNHYLTKSPAQVRAMSDLVFMEHFSIKNAANEEIRAMLTDVRTDKLLSGEMSAEGSAQAQEIYLNKFFNRLEQNPVQWDRFIELAESYVKRQSTGRFGLGKYFMNLAKVDPETAELKQALRDYEFLYDHAVEVDAYSKRDDFVFADIYVEDFETQAQVFRSDLYRTTKFDQEMKKNPDYFRPSDSDDFKLKIEDLKVRLGTIGRQNFLKEMKAQMKTEAKIEGQAKNMSDGDIKSLAKAKYKEILEMLKQLGL